MRGLEPLRLAASDPKSDTSTNFATSADAYRFKQRKVKLFILSNFKLRNIFKRLVAMAKQKPPARL